MVLFAAFHRCREARESSFLSFLHPICVADLLIFLQPHPFLNSSTTVSHSHVPQRERSTNVLSEDNLSNTAKVDRLTDVLPLPIVLDTPCCTLSTVNLCVTRLNSSSNTSPLVRCHDHSQVDEMRSNSYFCRDRSYYGRR